MKTTNYYDTFIAVADDCPVEVAEAPPRKAQAPTAAYLQFEMLHGSPYEFTSDDVLFHVHATMKNIGPEDVAKARADFFAKGQPCFRASPLTKRYGWGVHSDAAGRIAIHAMESPEYHRLVRDERLRQVKALRSRRA